MTGHLIGPRRRGRRGGSERDGQTARVRTAGTAGNERRRRLGAAGHPQAACRAGRVADEPQQPGRRRQAHHGALGRLAAVGREGQHSLLRVQPAKAARRFRGRLATGVGRGASWLSPHHPRQCLRHRAIHRREDRGRAGRRRRPVRTGRQAPVRGPGGMARAGARRPARLSVRRRLRHLPGRGEDPRAHGQGGGRNRLRARGCRHHRTRGADRPSIPTASRCGRS